MIRELIQDINNISALKFENRRLSKLADELVEENEKLKNDAIKGLCENNRCVIISTGNTFGTRVFSYGKEIKHLKKVSFTHELYEEPIIELEV